MFCPLLSPLTKFGFPETEISVRRDTVRMQADCSREAKTLATADHERVLLRRLEARLRIDVLLGPRSRQLRLIYKV